MGKKINIDKTSNQTQLVGYLRNEIVEQLDFNLCSKEIIIYPGVIKHIRERHPYAFKKYFHRLPEMIDSPDYIGSIQGEGHRLELIKRFKEHVLIALKIEEGSSIFVSSMYIIEENVVEKKAETGKLYRLHLRKTADEERKSYKNIKKRRKYFNEI